MDQIICYHSYIWGNRSLGTKERFPQENFNRNDLITGQGPFLAPVFICNFLSSDL